MILLQNCLSLCCRLTGQERGRRLSNFLSCLLVAARIVSPFRWVFVEQVVSAWSPRFTCSIRSHSISAAGFCFALFAPGERISDSVLACCTWLAPPGRTHSMLDRVEKWQKTRKTFIPSILYTLPSSCRPVVAAGPMQNACKAGIPRVLAVLRFTIAAVSQPTDRTGDRFASRDNCALRKHEKPQLLHCHATVPV